MRNYSRLMIVVSHECLDEQGEDNNVEMTNGHTSITLPTFESALGMLPPGSRVHVVARGSVGDKTVHRLSRIIRESCVYVSLDLSEATEFSRVTNSPFEGNKNLLVIRFPGNLSAINARAFADCTALELVSIPATCRQIGEEAFLGCCRLNSLIFVNPEGWLCDSASDKKLIIPSLEDPGSNPENFVLEDGAYAHCRLIKRADV